MLFISHSSLDRTAADAAFQRFLAHGYDRGQVFLDSEPDSIAAGAIWMETLEERLKGCQALILLCTKNWVASKWCFAELMVAKTLGKAIFPVILEPCELDVVSSAIQGVLVHRDGEAAWKHLLTALGNSEFGPRDEFAWPPAGVEDHCPYPGLAAFEERYAGVYFGRKAETGDVQETLRKMRGMGEPRFLMIVGGSGSGKSSLLKAGVLPRLKHKTSASEWLVLPTLRYGHAPNEQQTVFDQLAMNVATQAPTGHPINWRALRDGMTSPEPQTAVRAFLDALQDVLVAQDRAEATVVLPIDQFEELMAPSAGPTASDFLRFLKDVFSSRNGKLLGIGTLRSDQLDSYERHRHALAAPFLRSWRLGPFPLERLPEIILKPAERMQVSFEPELLRQLEKDHEKQRAPSGDRAGAGLTLAAERKDEAEALPLLAFTLEKLYRKYADDKKLELKEYKELGGMEGAIQTSIDRFVRIEELPADTLNALRLSFVKHLARFDSNDNPVRVRARWSDLPEAARPLLQKFVEERLLVSDAGPAADRESPEALVEVAHEAIFRAWPQLKTWLSTSADILRWRRDVTRDRANRQWRRLSTVQLAVARRWPAQRPEELTEDEVKWIRKGLRRKRMLAWAGAAVLVLISALAGLGWRQREATERERQVSLSRSLASQSEELRQSQPGRLVQSLLLAIEGYRRNPSELTAKALRAGLGITPLPVARLHFKGGVTSVQFSPEGRRLAAVDKRGGVSVWDYTERRQLAATTVARPVRNIIWRPDGEQIAMVLSGVNSGPSQPDEIHLWDWRRDLRHRDEVSPGLLRTLSPARQSPSWMMSVFPDQLHLWPRQGKKTTRRLAAQLAGPMAVSGSGSLLAIADAQGLHIVDTATGHPVKATFAPPTGVAISVIAFSPREDSIAIGMNDGVTRIWRWSTNTTLAERAVHREPVALTFSPDGRLVAETEQSSGAPSFAIWPADGRASLYEVDTPAQPPQEPWYPTICFTQDGKFVIFTLGDRSVRLLSLSDDDTVIPLRQFTTEERINDVAVDRSGRLVAVAAADGWVTVWNTERGPFAQHFDGTKGMLASPAGDSIALLGANARVVSAGSGSAIADLGTESNQAVFSADGSSAAFVSASAVTSVEIASKRRQSWPVSAAPVAMSFTSDGRGLLMAEKDGMLTSIDLANGQRRTIVQTKGQEGGTFSRDARFFGEKGPETAIRIYDLARGSATELPSNASSPALCLSPRGDYAASQPENHSVAVWSTKTRKEVQRIRVSRAPSLMSFDSTGGALAVTDGAAVTIIDIPQGRNRRTFTQRGGEIAAISFSPDGHYLATVSEDDNARIWRTADGELVMTIPQGNVPHRPRSVAFSGDGKYLLLQQGNVRSYLWQPADLIREACRRSIRAKLDETEWHTYLKEEPYRETCDAATLR